MSDATLLPRKVHRKLVLADQELFKEDVRLRSLIQLANDRIRDAESRRDEALRQMDARLDRRMEIARAIPGGVERGQADLNVLKAKRRQCEAEHTAVLTLARDTLSALEGKLARIKDERLSLRRNAEWVEYEIEAGQIVAAPPPLVRSGTVVGFVMEVAKWAQTSARSKVEGAQRGLQRTLDGQRLDRGEPLQDLPTPDLAPTSDAFDEDALITRREQAFDRTDSPQHRPHIPPPPRDYENLLDRVATLGLPRRTPRRDLLPRLIIIGCLAFFLLLLGAFIGRALTP